MEEKWSLNLLILQSLLIDGHICILHSFEMVNLFRGENPKALRMLKYMYIKFFLPPPPLFFTLFYNLKVYLAGMKLTW